MAPSYRVFGWIFPRALALIYIIAFASWSWQAEALTGEKGIMPVPKFLENAAAYAQQEGIAAWIQFPTVYWLGYSDAFAQGLFLGACIAAVLVMMGLLQGPLLLALWFAYLSICTTGNVFMGYQWDALLLETGFISTLISPWRLFAGRMHDGLPAPSRVQMLLPQALIFKLMFLSGVVKLTSGDPTWHNFTALTYHYETQPIPTWLGWYAHQLPEWFQKVSCFLMFIIEIGMPLLLLIALAWQSIAPGWMRTIRTMKLFFTGTTAGLMVITQFTGNYTFFNLLTILLALSALDDGCWPGSLKRWLRWTDAPPARPRWQFVAQNVVVAMMLALSATVVMQNNVPMFEALSARLHGITRHLEPFRSVSSYGLFRVMTTERNEITIEVSDDGVYFQPLEFKWKPGRLDRAPPFVAPHQARLDWQMWFASFNPGFIPQRDMRNPQMVWFAGFMGALLDHHEAVYALMEPPPFPIESIRAVRAKFYRYEFTDAETRRETGAWWTATALGDYSPTFSRQ